MSFGFLLVACAALHAAPTTVAGRVVDFGGAPVARAQVEVVDRLVFDAPKGMEGQSARASADTDGRFSLSVPFAPRLARATAEGYDPASRVFIEQWVPVTAGQPLELKLQKTMSVTGTVVDEAGAPVVGANVMLAGSDERVDRPTDAGGQFAELPLKGGSRELLVYKRGYETQNVQVTSSSLKVVLKKRAVLAVYLVDQQGRPIAGHNSVESLRPDGSRIGSCTTRPVEGDCTLDAQPGPVKVRATVNGKTVEQTVAAETQRKLDVRLVF